MDDRRKESERLGSNVRIASRVQGRTWQLPGRSDDEHRKLAEWCQAQRRRFRLGRLLERRRMKLNDLGFEWSPAATDRWGEMFVGFLTTANKQDRANLKIVINQAGP